MEKLSVMTIGSGCFWCTERIYKELDGVYDINSGYMGGHIKNPTYREVCSGLTGHAEVIQFKYDPKIISEEELFEIFWLTHDPTTLNQQGNDHGTQYRSVIFYHKDSQLQNALKVLKSIEARNLFKNKIVTELTAASEFYPAEEYHQDYYNNNLSQPYCQLIISPKLNKFRKWYKK